MATLAGNTFALVLLTLTISLPIGTLLAVLLTRTDLPGRRFWLGLLILQLFVPLYVHAAAWDAGFGVLGWFTTWIGTDAIWLHKLRGAVWVHAVTALPWVVLIVAAGLWLVEPELEEEALLHAPHARVFWHVTLRRSAAAAAIGVAAIWVAVTTAGEMTATDLFRVDTFAEVVYVSLVGGADWPRALLAVLPLVLVVAGLVIFAVPVCARLTPPPRTPSARTLPTLRLGPWRWPCTAIVAGVVLLITAVPLGSLCYQAGMGATKIDAQLVRAWSLGKFADMVFGSPARFGDELSWSLQLAALAATGAVVFGLAMAWLARTGGLRATPTIGLTAAAMALPGPLIGLALIWLLNRREIGLFVFLYDRTLLAPWLALLVKTLPWATLILWFALRSIPAGVLDAAATDGAGPSRRLLQVALPLRLPALAVAWLVAFALSLGDLAATVIVLPPGVETLSVRIFRLIHSASYDQIAGLCLALLALLAAVTGTVVWLIGRRWFRGG